MKIILLEKVDKLGEKGDEAEVKPGYFRHWLERKKLAALPDSSQALEVRASRAKAEQEQTGVKTQIKKIAEKLDKKTLTFRVRSGAKGKLYGSVGPKEIAKELKIKPEQVLGGPFDKVGEYQVKIKLSSEDVAEAKVVIVAIKNKK